MPGLFPFEEDEGEKWGALLGMPPLSAPALSDPSMQPQGPPGPEQAELALNQTPPLGHAENRDKPAPVMDHWQALADGLPEPPQMEAHRDQTGLILAMFADAILNKGRSLGPLVAAASKPLPNVDRENYELQRQHALDRAGIAERMQRSQGDPETLAIRKAENDARMRALGLQEQQFKANQANGGLTPYQLKEFEARHQESAGRDADRDEDRALRREQMRSSQAARTEAASMRADLADERRTRQQQVDHAENARKFTKDSGKYLELGQAIREVDGDFAKHPKDLPGVGELDRFQLDNDWPLVGAGEDGLKVRKDLANVRDILARERSGAAFAGNEKKELYRLAAGLDSSNEAEIRASIAGIKKLVQGSLRARRVGREDVADEVLGESGLGNFLGNPGASRETRGPAATGPGLGVVPGQAPPMVRDVINPDDDEWEDIR
jgi:hypothetical protein